MTSQPRRGLCSTSPSDARTFNASRKGVRAASSLEKDLKGTIKAGADKAAAVAIGKLIAERAIKAGIKDVVFDRGGYLYHGRVKALADAAREGGLNF